MKKKDDSSDCEALHVRGEYAGKAGCDATRTLGERRRHVLTGTHDGQIIEMTNSKKRSSKGRVRNYMSNKAAHTGGKGSLVVGANIWKWKKKRMEKVRLPLEDRSGFKIPKL